MLSESVHSGEPKLCYDNSFLGVDSLLFNTLLVPRTYGRMGFTSLYWWKVPQSIADPVECWFVWVLLNDRTLDLFLNARNGGSFLTSLSSREWSFAQTCTIPSKTLKYLHFLAFLISSYLSLKNTAFAPIDEFMYVLLYLKKAADIVFSMRLCCSHWSKCFTNDSYWLQNNVNCKFTWVYVLLLRLHIYQNCDL